jgi:hypothetical protein
MRIFRGAVLALIVAVMSVTAWGAREVKPKDFSGWLDDYDSLVFSEELNAFVFFNEDMRGKYDKILLQSVTVFARDATTNRGIADQASDYLTREVRKMLDERGILATEPGPGVLRFHMAITGVQKSKEELKAHNVIPVSALFRGAKAATGKLDTFIDAMFEAEMVDSVSGESAAAIVRRGIGATDKKSGDEMTFEDVQPTLDVWLESYSKTLDAFLARRN